MFAPAPSLAVASTRSNPAFASDVAYGLTQSPQKSVPPSWLYDDVGSALFEAITVLPEYGLTRADGALLARSADEIIRAAQRPGIVIELGSGTGSKTRHLLRAAAAASMPVEYRPIDISGAALRNCEASLRDIHGIRIEPVESTYLEGIDYALANRRPADRAVILFLGSTIGNFSRPEAGTFLHRLRQRVIPGDTLLLGADLVKPRDVLIAAYDDPVGVTAAFNRNLLARINRELGGEFDLARFAHEARYDERQSRIEMHLRSLVSQRVFISEPGLTVSFESGETIWTESSHKFRAPDIRRMGEQAGWQMAHQWLDHEWGFAEALFTA